MQSCIRNSAFRIRFRSERPWTIYWLALVSRHEPFHLAHVRSQLTSATVTLRASISAVGNGS